ELLQRAMERERKAEQTRRGRVKRVLQAIGVVGLCAVPRCAAADAAAVSIFARYNVRTAHIQPVGTLFNGQQEVRGGGSGLLIGDSLVLTNNHVIPPETNYRTLRIEIRLSSRQSSPVLAKAVYRDPTHDLALLELNTPASSNGGPKRCP